MATSLRQAPVGRQAPKSWDTDPREHRWLLGDASQTQGARITTLENLIAVANPSAVGSLFLQAASATFPNLGSVTWVPITQYDTTVPAVAADAKGVTLDPVAGTIAFKVTGLWRLDFTFSMVHDESNQGRTMELRRFNVTDGTASSAISVAIGRNQPGTNYAISAVFEIGAADLDDPIRIEAKMAAGSGGLNTISFEELGIIGTYADSFAKAGDNVLDLL